MNHFYVLHIENIRSPYQKRTFSNWKTYVLDIKNVKPIRLPVGYHLAGKILVRSLQAMGIFLPDKEIGTGESRIVTCVAEK